MHLIPYSLLYDAHEALASPGRNQFASNVALNLTSSAKQIRYAKSLL
jgi:hypothetical protein